MCKTAKVKPEVRVIIFLLVVITIFAKMKVVRVIVNESAGRPMIMCRWAWVVALSMEVGSDSAVSVLSARLAK